MDGRFRQTCMNVASTSQVENKDTGCNDLWDRPLHYLDRHAVECPTGKFLTRDRLGRSGCDPSTDHGKNNMKIEYTCMAISTPNMGPADARCYLKYCNAHDDLKNAFCGGAECTTKQHYLSCQKHWNDYGKGEFASGDRSCNPEIITPCTCGVTPDPTPSPTPTPPTCSGEGTIMPGEYCGPMADVYGEKCCSDGGHSCVYVNASEYFCLPCDHNDMHSVGWGDADRHCNQNDFCAYDAGTSKCKSKPAGDASSEEGPVVWTEHAGECSATGATKTAITSVVGYDTITVELCQLMCGFNCRGYSTDGTGEGAVSCTIYVGGEEITAGDGAAGGTCQAKSIKDVAAYDGNYVNTTGCCQTAAGKCSTETHFVMTADTPDKCKTACNNEFYCKGVVFIGGAKMCMLYVGQREGTMVTQTAESKEPAAMQCYLRPAAAAASTPAPVADPSTPAPAASTPAPMNLKMLDRVRVYGKAKTIKKAKSV